MAEHAGDYHRGEMEITEQKATFHGFIGLTKWGSLTFAVLILFLSLFLAAHAGFFQAFLASVVVAVAGFFLLREKKTSGH